MATSEHYFAKQPQSKSEPTTFNVRVRDLNLVLAGDRSVFNQGDLDWGTRVLIENAELPPGKVMLDLGCGGGAIAIALATLRPEATVWAVDINERALEVARRTVTLNKLNNIYVVHPDEVPENLVFDAIWSNPPIRIGKDELHRLLSLWLARLSPGGCADLVAHKNLGSDSLARWLTEQGFDVTRARSKQGYRVLHVTRA